MEVAGVGVERVEPLVEVAGAGVERVVTVRHGCMVAVLTLVTIVQLLDNIVSRGASDGSDKALEYTGTRFIRVYNS